MSRPLVFGIRKWVIDIKTVSGTNSSGNSLADLVAMAVSAAVTKAAPNYMPLAYQANAEALVYPGPGFPPGPYARIDGGK